MEITRREAVAALAAAGVAIGGGAAALAVDRNRDELFDGWESVDHDLKTLRALVEVLYPSEVSATDGFIETYVLGRIGDNQTYRDAISDAVATLDEHANDRHGKTFVNLALPEREELLHDMGLTSTEPDPEGTDIEQVRYYLVNELLFALFTTPKGGKLVGAENPTGYPGGLAAYQRGPQS